MKRFFREHGIFLALLAVKLLTVARTGWDTYDVSHDWLDVALIDGAYLTFWLIAAYAGTSKQALALRPFAAGAAWLLYALMLSIAWQAGQLHQALTVSLLARIAGAALLLYDTWDFVVALAIARRGTQSAGWKAGLRSGLSGMAYFVVALLAFPAVIVIQMLQVVRDYAADAKPAKPAGRRTEPAYATDATDIALYCEDCGRTFGTKQARNAHARWCTGVTVKPNGNGHRQPIATP